MFFYSISEGSVYPFYDTSPNFYNDILLPLLLDQSFGPKSGSIYVCWWALLSCLYKVLAYASAAFSLLSMVGHP